MQGVRSRDQVPSAFLDLDGKVPRVGAGNNLTLPVFYAARPVELFFEGQRPCRSANLAGRMQPAGGEVPIISQIARILNNRC